MLSALQDHPCNDRHGALPRLWPHVQRLRGERAPRAGFQASPSRRMAEHSAMRVEQVGLWLRRAIKGIVMLRQTSKATTRIAARSKENPALAQLRPEADTARHWPAGRAGSSTYKVGGRHAARIPDRAPLRGALYSSRLVHASQASCRVGFGTRALAVQLRPKPLGRPKQRVCKIIGTISRTSARL